MKLEATFIEGLYVMHRPVHQDNRGQFTRLFAAEGLAAAGRPTEGTPACLKNNIKLIPVGADIFVNCSM